MTARPLPAAALATALALAWFLFGPPGGDAAAHLYQTQVWTDHGWRLWDNFWYAGRYSQINYSLLYYPLAATIGNAAAACLAVGAAAGFFARVVRRQWPGLATWPVIAFAALAPLTVPAGTYPFTLGLAVGLATVTAIQARRTAWTLAGAVTTTLSHPLALVFLIAASAGAAAVTPGWHRDRRLRLIALALGTATALQVVLLRAFSASGGQYPFDPKDAAAVAVFCALGLLAARGLRDMRVLAGVVAAYGLLTLVALALTSPIGGNVGRLLLVMATPLLLLPLAARGFRPRWLVAALVAPALFWQVLPTVSGWRTAAETRAQHEAFWEPAVAFAEANRDPGYRIEVVATADNWESLYLARRGVPLARGWFRQDDWPENAVLYQQLSAAEYRAWLRRMGVRHVYLADEPLDLTARREAEILRSGRSGLRLVSRVGAWSFYELPGADPIATPADGVRVARLSQQAVRLEVSRPGRYRLSLRYTPYWRIRAGAACVSPREPWGTWVTVTRPGTVEIDFAVRPRRMIGAVLGRRGACPTPGSPVVVLEL